MHIITSAELKRALPKSEKIETWVDPLNDAMLTYGISDDVAVMIEFIAQCAHESAGFTRLVENLNYTVDRLRKVWPKRFPDDASAAECAGNGYALAERVYGGRMGNRTAHDAWNYRGRGLIMVTGRDNYQRVSKLLNDPAILLCPDRLCTQRVAAMAACAWWASDSRLSDLARDEANDDDEADFRSITRIVNGGAQGLAERASYREAFKAALRG